MKFTSVPGGKSALAAVALFSALMAIAVHQAPEMSASQDTKIAAALGGSDSGGGVNVLTADAKTNYFSNSLSQTVWSGLATPASADISDPSFVEPLGPPLGTAESRNWNPNTANPILGSRFRCMNRNTEDRIYTGSGIHINPRAQSGNMNTVMKNNGGVGNRWPMVGVIGGSTAPGFGTHAVKVVFTRVKGDAEATTYQTFLDLNKTGNWLTTGSPGIAANGMTFKPLKNGTSEETLDLINAIRLVVICRSINTQMKMSNVSVTTSATTVPVTNDGGYPNNTAGSDLIANGSYNSGAGQVLYWTVSLNGIGMQNGFTVTADITPQENVGGSGTFSTSAEMSRFEINAGADL